MNSQTKTRKPPPDRDLKIFRAGFLVGQQMVLERLKERQNYFHLEVTRACDATYEKMLIGLLNEQLSKPDDDLEKLGDIRRFILD